MQDPFLILVRVVFSGLFIATVASGIYLWKNDQRFFGTDSAIPSEGTSARAYTRVQVYSVWAHVLFLTGAFALLIH